MFICISSVILIVRIVMIQCCLFFFFKQKTAYEMRISDWSSDVCSSDLAGPDGGTIAFEIDPFRKHCLLNGLDDIGLTLAHAADNDAYEAKLKQDRPWLVG